MFKKKEIVAPHIISDTSKNYSNENSTNDLRADFYNVTDVRYLHPHPNNVRLKPVRYVILQQNHLNFLQGPKLSSTRIQAVEDGFP